MELLDILAEDQILLDLTATTQLAALEELSEILVAKGIVLEKQGFVSAVLEREVHATTGIGQGIAIPHGKSSVVRQSAVVIGRTRHGIEWQALDEAPVNLIFLLAIPETDSGNQHLQVLSGLAKKLLDEELIEQLKLATEAATVRTLLN